MILERSLGSIRDGLAESGRLERQIATGRAFQYLSEAPLAARSVLDIDGDLRASEQYTRSIEAARTRLAIADSTLQGLNDLLARARELAIQFGGDVWGANERFAGQVEVQELRAAVIQLANRSHNGAFVFGGTYADRPPLDAAGALDPTFPARGAQQYEIGPGALAYGAHDAGEVFIDSDVIGSLDALDAALGANDTAAIQTAGARLGDTFAALGRLVADIGARQIRLDVAQEQQAVVNEGLQTRRSTLADATLEESITRLASVQSAYQASLLATSRLLETSLVNYLR